MFIPPNRLKNKFASLPSTGNQVQLKSSHLLIDNTVAAQVFGDDLKVHVVYYPDRKMLMIAPISDDLFKKLHKAKEHLLKARNAKGDKSIALHEILIDNQIDFTDRELEYEAEIGLRVLSVKI